MLAEYSRLLGLSTAICPVLYISQEKARSRDYFDIATVQHRATTGVNSPNSRLQQVLWILEVRRAGRELHVRQVGREHRDIEVQGSDVESDL